jgi:transposase-like protein
MLFLDIVEATETKEEALEWARSKDLLLSKLLCFSCQCQMKRESTNEAPDFEVYRCPKCHTKKSIRWGSIFFGSKLSIHTIILLIFLWSRGDTNKQIITELRISDKTMTHWAHFFRSTCVKYNENMIENDKIGGVGHVVEIDESILTRRKYNRGRVSTERWVFGGIMRDTEGQCRSFVELVKDRKETTLLEIIKRRIEPGTTIISDGWRSYFNLHNHGYTHFVINHSANFVDPQNRTIHTQNIENYWKHLKFWLKSRGNNLGDALPEYLAEYLYRKRHYNVFVSLIANFSVQSS